MKYTLILLGALLMPLSFLNAQYYVSKKGSDKNDGLSWDTAFATVEKAISSAPEGTVYHDEFGFISMVEYVDIYVAKGTYTEKTLTPKNAQRLYGGYAGEGDNPYERDFINNKTTLSIIFNTDSSGSAYNFDGFTFASNGRIIITNRSVGPANYAYVNNCYFNETTIAISIIAGYLELNNVAIKVKSGIPIQLAPGALMATNTTVSGGLSAVKTGTYSRGNRIYYGNAVYLYNCTLANSTSSSMQLYAFDYAYIYNSILWPKNNRSNSLYLSSANLIEGYLEIAGSVIRGNYNNKVGYTEEDPYLKPMEWKSGIVPSCRIGKNSSARNYGSYSLNEPILPFQKEDMFIPDVKGLSRKLGVIDAGALQYDDIEIIKDLSTIDGYIGKDAVLSVECVEAYQQTYQWQKYGKDEAGKSVWLDIEGATTNSYTIENITADMAGQKYRCVMTNIDGPIYSKEVAIAIREDAGIPEEIPSPAVGYDGRTATISVVASGYKPSYQWQSWDEDLQDWVDVEGATSAKLTIKNIVKSMNGTKYKCIVSNGGNTLESNEVTFEVHDNLTILEQPKSIDIYVGKNGTFNILADGYNTKYAWYLSKNGGAKWSAVSGGTKSALTIKKASTAMSGYQYYCKVYNDKGSLESDVVGFLNVREPAVFVSAPSRYEEQQVSVASGTGFDLNYQWQVFENGAWEDIESETYPEFTHPMGSVIAGKAFRCEISNTAERLNPVYSNEIWPASSGGISTFTGLTPQVTYNGDNAVFFIDLQSSTKYKYTWYTRANSSADWKKTGSNSATLKVSKPKVTADGAEYKCVLTFADQTIETNVVSLTVLEKVKITAQTKSTTSFDGQNVTFSVATVGHDVKYQWQKYVKNAAGKWVWVDIEDANESSYMITAIEYAQNGEKYRCAVSNTGDMLNVKYSGIMKLTVKKTVSIVSHPEDVVAATGSKASFAVKASGAASIKYQWSVSTDEGLTWTDIPKATKASYALKKLTKDLDGYKYKCVVSNGGGSFESDPATLTVYQKTTPQALPSKVSAQADGKIELDVLTEAGAVYTWEAKLPGSKEWVVVYSGDVAYADDFSMGYADLPLDKMTIWEEEAGEEEGETVMVEKPLAPVGGMKLRCLIESPFDSATSKQTSLTLITS